MKAEHRHELKTNDLALWISNLPNWANQNMRTIIYTVVGVVLILAAVIYYVYQKTVVSSKEQGALTALLFELPQRETFIAQNQMKGEDNSFQLFQFSDALDNIAKTTSSDSIAALALIKEAQLLRTELGFRFGTPGTQDISTQIGKAKDLYNKALNTYLSKSPNATLEGIARTGLGICEEELGNAEEARKIYEEVATGTAYAGTVAATEAKQRILAMDSFTEKVALKPMPRKKVETQPTTILEPNAPAQN
jgi:tetratricopeptide (TPR) repeat protein